jgi:dolichol-phosphate mannosyltransferase
LAENVSGLAVEHPGAAPQSGSESPVERWPSFGAPWVKYAPAELSIVVPTFNERGNLRELVARIDRALRGIAWEVVFVDDDSPDGTSTAAREIYNEDARVRCIRRFGRRGLASACIEGMLSCSSRFVAVMDADLQHDPGVLVRMLETMRGGNTELVLATRYSGGGGVGDWDATRVKISRLATSLANSLMTAPVSDPMSGYFMLRRDVFEQIAPRLSSLGFKILLDILLTLPPKSRIREVPFQFGKRLAGESKLSTGVAWEFLLLIADKLVGRWVPVRFLAFAAIGSIGIGVHFAVLTTLFKGMHWSFASSQAVATALAMVFNFSVNNLLTYAGQSLRGLAWFKGLGSFALVCGLGAAANVGAANWLFGQSAAWPVAAMAGVLVSAVWNYAVSARYTWRNS